MVSLEWHSCSPGHNIWKIILVLPLSLYFLYLGSLIKYRGHHNTGKSILLKPGSLRRSQYVLLLTQVSLLDLLWSQQSEQIFSRSNYCELTDIFTIKSCYILEKTWLVRHVVVLEHFPSLPLELLYPLFLLLGSIDVSFLQKPSIKLEKKKKASSDR